jgi:hypothetical protein
MARHGKLEQGRDNMGLDMASTKGEVADDAREMGCGHRGRRRAPTGCERVGKLCW